MKKEKTFEFKAGEVFVRPQDIHDLWECKWDILDKDKEKILGYCSFAGKKENGAIPFYIEIFDKYDRNKGYGTDVMKTMREWAFYHREIFEITAVCEHENSSCIMALQKAGFVFRSAEHEIEHYSIIKQKTSWMGLYICIGITAGLIMAAVLSIPWIGLVIGIVAGLGLGASMDAKENAYRKKIMGDR